MLRAGGVLLTMQPLRRLLALALAAAVAAPAAARIRVVGSTTVSPVVAAAARILREERGLQIVVDTLGGSSGGIAALGDGRAEVAMSSRPVLPSDRERYPGVRFREVEIGRDAVALAVSRDVWEGGVRAISRDQARAVYEGRVANWRELGGPDRRIVFFNKEPGRGTWEVFAHWLYGDSDLAPLVSLPEVGSNEEARNKTRSTPGSITQLSVAWVDGRAIAALAIVGDNGQLVRPSGPSLASGAYPLARSLLLVTDGEPAAETARLIDFLVGVRGQRLVAAHGYLPLSSGSAASP
ncbi:MAG: phosphate ABC transporter substrate-binding protein [Thermoanaerobaculia bacterium]|nr:phosphate ABC transporter substrate-binding protein [Thermoanaerobaculia bacterium]